MPISTREPREPLSTCILCDREVPSDTLVEHQHKVHGFSVSVTKTAHAVKKPEIKKSEPVQSSAVTPSSSNERTKTKEILLFSKRCIRLEGRVRCDECKTYNKGVDKYAASTCGVVHICLGCKNKVFDRSFGPVDMMSVAFQGGLVESKRRRH